MFLGDSPNWYKNTIIAFLVINPIILLAFKLNEPKWKFYCWLDNFIRIYIYTCFSAEVLPLQPGGLIAIQALFLGLTNPYSLLHEIEHNLEVILLLVFMVAGIYFMKNLMLTIFTKLLLTVKSKTKLS